MPRLTIDRLELDLRGVPPAAAEAVARRLGPALAEAMRGHRLNPQAVQSLDLGHLAVPSSATPDAMAGQIAGRIAQKASGE